MDHLYLECCESFVSQALSSSDRAGEGAEMDSDDLWGRGAVLWRPTAKIRRKVHKIIGIWHMWTLTLINSCHPHHR